MKHEPWDTEESLLQQISYWNDRKKPLDSHINQLKSRLQSLRKSQREGGAE